MFKCFSTLEAELLSVHKASLAKWGGNTMLKQSE